jgi:spermidine synthase
MIRLGDYESAYGTITILKAKTTGAVIYEQQGYFQSEGDSNGTSLASYVHALFSLVWQANAQSVLMIGCAGGTLGTMLARAGRSVTIVDVNPVSFPLARLYFKLPESVECHVADGRAFLLDDARRYDAIVLDAYLGDYIPAHLQSIDFFKLLQSRLNSSGAMFANVHTADDLDDSAGRVAGHMAAAWPNVRILDTQGSRGRNAIIMAGAVSQLTRPYVLVPPAAEADVIDTELAMMSFRLRQSTP